jgi:hypothetical protein
LKQLHSEALHRAAAEVELDVLELYFMNSSCLKALVSWIDSVENDGKALYHIRFRTNPKLLWQRRVWKPYADSRPSSFKSNLSARMRDSAKVLGRGSAAQTSHREFA